MVPSGSPLSSFEGLQFLARLRMVSRMPIAKNTIMAIVSPLPNFFFVLPLEEEYDDDALDVLESLVSDDDEEDFHVEDWVFERYVPEEYEVFELLFE